MGAENPQRSDPFQVTELLNKWGDKSLELMRRHAKIPDINLESYQPDFPVQGHWMTMATLNSKIFKMSFKMFFTTEEGAIFCRDVFRSESQSISHAQLNDFTKELCNLIVGHIKYDFERHSVGCSTSLPMSLRSFDDLFFEPDGLGESSQVYWRFHLDGSDIVCALKIEIMDPDVFRNLNLDVNTQVQSGTFELI